MYIERHFNLKKFSLILGVKIILTFFQEARIEQMNDQRRRMKQQELKRAAAILIEERRKARADEKRQEEEYWKAQREVEAVNNKNII